MVKQGSKLFSILFLLEVPANFESSSRICFKNYCRNTPENSPAIFQVIYCLVFLQRFLKKIFQRYFFKDISRVISPEFPLRIPPRIHTRIFPSSLLEIRPGIILKISPRIALGILPGIPPGRYHQENWYMISRISLDDPPEFLHGFVLGFKRFLQELLLKFLHRILPYIPARVSSEVILRTSSAITLAKSSHKLLLENLSMDFSKDSILASPLDSSKVHSGGFSRTNIHRGFL